MMRADPKLLFDLKLLKEVKGGGTHLELVGALVKIELMKTHALTTNGYVGIGSVVSCGDGVPLVIKCIVGDNVNFSDGTFVINGGHTCMGLVLVAKSTSSYEGGFHIV